MTTYRGLRASIYHAVIVAMVATIVTACGMKPFEPRNNREEGPEKGLFSGSKGEFVILGVEGIDKKDQTEEKAESPDQ